MRYLCTIYTHQYSFVGHGNGTGSEPSFETPLASVVVSGSSYRQAAARAYVRCVGRKRAKNKNNPDTPRDAKTRETSTRAIAASLRKTMQRIGECYEMDNFLHGWFIKVEQLPVSIPMPRRLRQPSALLYHPSPTPSPN